MLTLLPLASPPLPLVRLFELEFPAPEPLPVLLESALLSRCSGYTCTNCDGGLLASSTRNCLKHSNCCGSLAPLVFSNCPNKLPNQVSNPLLRCLIISIENEFIILRGGKMGTIHPSPLNKSLNLLNWLYLLYTVHCEGTAVEQLTST